MTERDTLRAAAAQALRILGDERLELAERVRQASAARGGALDASAGLPPARRAALNADPGVRAMLARLAASDEPCVPAGPEGVYLSSEKLTT